MRPSSISVFFLVAGITSGRVVQHLARPSHGVALEYPVLKTHLLPLNSTITASTEPDHDKPDDKKDEEDRFFTEPERETIWNNAVCRGKNLLHAMLLDEIDAREILQWPHVQSAWDGDMKAELQRWGYIEDEEGGALDRQCDFAGYHRLTDAFRELGIDTRSVGMGGSNRCYHFAHRDGLAITRLPDGSLPPVSEQYYKVDGKKYRVTNGFSKIGINAKNGLIAFLHRRSPAKGAQAFWSQDPIHKSDLPRLRASSDLAYAMWYRETTTENRKDVRKFLAVGIVNKETWVIISRALDLQDPEDWYGTPAYAERREFVFFNTETEENRAAADTEAAYALLGSPNGLAVGYFLNQHKRQLGGDKFIWRISVFLGD